MDSMQLRRENKTDEREIHVEKDKVPKIASHFESLTVKDSGDHPVAHHVIGQHDQSEVPGLNLHATEGPEKSQQTSGLSGTVVDVMKKGASYVGEKAVVAKDVVVETGKTTVGGVGKVAEVVKDKAVVVGWSAAEFASDKAVGATETVANVSSTVAGFAGDTVVATKDVIVGVGKKTKDMVVATEESAKDYAARKKAEKQRELEAKNAKDETEWVGEEHNSEFEHQGGGDFDEKGGFEQQGGGGFIEEGGLEHDGGGGGFKYEGSGAAAAVGVMRVIGETLVEIGRNTKDMVVGQGGYEEEQQFGESRRKKC